MPVSRSNSSANPTKHLQHSNAEAASTRVVVPAGSPSWVTEELIELTLKTWQPFYSHQLIETDALEMIVGVDQLFGVMSRGRCNEAIRGTGESQQS